MYLSVYFLRIKIFFYATTIQLTNFRKLNVDRILVSDLSTFQFCPVMSYIAFSSRTDSSLDTFKILMYIAQLLCIDIVPVYISAGNV